MTQSTPVVVEEGTEYVVESTIGDGTFMGNDVDFYHFDLNWGDTIGIDVDALLMDDGTQLSTANIRIRLFDSSGYEVAYASSGYDPDNQQYTNDPYLEYTSYGGGTYYLGVSFVGHIYYYDPLDPFEGYGNAAHSYTYDDEGSRTSKTDLTTGEKTEYTWNHRHQLTKIVEKDDLGNVTKIVEYAYDPLGRRISKHIDNNGDGDTTDAGDDIDLFFYDGQHIALKTDESGNAENRYLHGPAIDMILADEDATGEVLWAATDHLGSVTHLLDFNGTSDTDVVATFTYDAFGKIVDETGTGVAFIFAYTGRERDFESDLQYNRARYYDADIGRWLSQDPISFWAGDENLYRYVGNGPTSKTDPSGLDEVRIYWFDKRVTWIPEAPRMFGFEMDYRGVDIGRFDDDGETVILDNGSRVSLPDLRHVANRVNTGFGYRGSKDTVDAARKKDILDRFRNTTPSGRSDGFGPLEFAKGTVDWGHNAYTGICYTATNFPEVASNTVSFFGRPYDKVENDLANGIFGTLDTKMDTWRGTGELTTEFASNFIPFGAIDDVRHLRHLKHLPDAPSGAVGRMNPSAIRFTQDTVSPNFSSGGNLTDAVNQLRHGQISPDDFPTIRVVEYNQKLYSLDNRRLTAFKAAQVDSIPVQRLNLCDPAVNAEFLKKFRPINDGLNNVVVPSAGRAEARRILREYGKYDAN